MLLRQVAHAHEPWRCHQLFQRSSTSGTAVYKVVPPPLRSSKVISPINPTVIGAVNQLCYMGGALFLAQIILQSMIWYHHVLTVHQIFLIKMIKLTSTKDHVILQWTISWPPLPRHRLCDAVASKTFSWDAPRLQNISSGRPDGKVSCSDVLNIIFHQPEYSPQQTRHT